MLLSLVPQDGSHSSEVQVAGAAPPSLKCSFDLPDSDVDGDEVPMSDGLRSAVNSMEEFAKSEPHNKHIVCEDDGASMFWPSDSDTDPDLPHVTSSECSNLSDMDCIVGVESEREPAGDCRSSDLSDSVDSMQGLGSDSDSVDPDSRRSQRFFMWPGPGDRGFKLAKVYRHGRHVGWGATCARHWDDGDFNCCKKQISLGVA